MQSRPAIFTSLLFLVFLLTSVGCSKPCKVCLDLSPTPPPTPTPPPPPTPPGAVPQPTPATVAPTAGIYLLNQLSTGDSQVVMMPLGANGTVTPTVYLTDPGVGLSGLHLSGAGNFFALESGSYYFDVLAFGATATGAFTPLRRIEAASFPASLNGPLAVDASGDVAVQGYASNVGYANAIYVEGPTANGVVTPARTITGSNTLIGNAFDISTAFDASGNLYVLEIGSTPTTSSILVFGPTANGNVAPTRVISPNVALTDLDQMAFDAAGNLYIADTPQPVSSSGSQVSNVYEFAAGASGSVSPIATLSVTGGYTLYTPAFDTTGALYLLVADATGNADVLKYAPGATGSAAPVSVIVTAGGASSGEIDASMVVVGP